MKNSTKPLPNLAPQSESPYSEYLTAGVAVLLVVLGLGGLVTGYTPEFLTAALGKEFAFKVFFIPKLMAILLGAVLFIINKSSISFGVIFGGISFFVLLLFGYATGGDW
jgi:hypothetical protein